MTLPQLKADQDLLSRMGRFKVSRKLIEEAPMEIKTLLGQFLIVGADWDQEEYQSIEYCAYCELFDIIPDGTYAPFYEIKTSKHNDLWFIDKVIREGEEDEN